MTCESVRTRLLEGDTADFTALDPHLSHCADCAALAGAIRRTESDLRQHVEAYVNPSTTAALDAQWARAERAVPAPPFRPLSLHGLLLGAAAVAVSIAVAVPGFDPGPADPDPGGDPTAASLGALPVAIREAREQLEGFRQIDTTRIDIEGLDRTAEDEVLKETLQRKAAAMIAAEEGLVAATEAGEPRWKVVALGDLGDLYRDMGDALERFQQPSYLTDEQRHVYASAIREKARVQHAKAIDVWQRGIEIAAEDDLPDLAVDLEARVHTLIARRAGASDPTGPDEARLDALDALARKAAAVAQRLERHRSCLAPARIDATQKILDAIAGAAEAGEGHRAADLEVLLDAGLPGLDKAIADCDR